MIRCLVAFSLLPALTAQTFLVDAGGGTGAHYTSLPAAVAGVPDGAVLVVKAGSYQPFTMTGKGLTILGEPGVVVSGQVHIDMTAPNQPVTIREVAWTAPTSGEQLLRFVDCGGAILLERITQPAGSYPIPFSLGVGVTADTCNQVTIRESQILCTVSLRDSHAAIESSTIRGESYFATQDNGRTAVYCSGGSLVIAGDGTLIEGGDGRIGGPAHDDPGNGVLLSATTLRAVGGEIRGGVVSAGSGSPVFGGSAITPVGSSRVSPRVTLFSSNILLPQELADDVMPQLMAVGDGLGGTLSATVDTEVGDLVVLALGLPGMATTLPGFQDPFWLDVGAHVFAAIGVHQTGIPVGGSAQVPASAGFLGLRLHWQAACFGPVTGTQATNPSVSLVR